MKRIKKLTAAMLAGTVMTAAMPLFPVYAEGETEENYTATITLNGTSATAEGENVTVDGSTVTISASGSYLISGTLEDGQIAVNVPDTAADAETVKLFFNGVNITGKTQAALYVVNAKNTSVNLMDGTENFLYDGTDLYDSAVKTTAVIYAKDDLTIKSGGTEGDGKLRIEATMNFGIHCNNDLKFTGGSVKVKTDAEDAVRGKTSVTVKGGKLDINAEGDGIKSTKGDVIISGGDTEIKSGKDAVQGETSVQISGGSLKANGDRALTNANETTGNVVAVTGGTILATGTKSQVIVADNTQPVLLFNTKDEQTKDQRIELIPSAEGAEAAFSKNPNKKFSYVMVSSDTLTPGTEYELHIGDYTASSYAVGGETKQGGKFTLAEGITTLEDVSFAGSSDKSRLDLNDDSSVDVADAVILARLLAEDQTLVVSPVTLARKDCNGDGYVSGDDVILILRTIAGLV